MHARGVEKGCGAVIVVVTGAEIAPRVVNLVVFGLGGGEELVGGCAGEDGG